MLDCQGQSCTIKKLLDPVSAANTAAATSGWIDARDAEGDIMFTVQVGALTGSITWTVESASDAGGTGAAAITPVDGAFTAGAANQTQKRNLNASSIQGFVRCVGTIVTGPALVSAAIHYQPKYNP